jgi:hypothetical protein
VIRCHQRGSAHGVDERGVVDGAQTERRAARTVEALCLGVVRRQVEVEEGPEREDEKECGERVRRTGIRTGVVRRFLGSVDGLQ